MSTHEETINLGVLLSVCIDAAVKAGEIIRKVWKSNDLQIQDKGVDDLFTKADVQSQQLIMALLRKKFGSNLALVGEEECEIPETNETPVENLVDLTKVPAAYQNATLKDVCVFIDPLDATKEFTLGNLEAVMSLVGIGYKGLAVGGVMYMPFVDSKSDPGKGTLIYGMLGGLGVHGIEIKERNDGRVIIATTRTHGTPEVEKAIELIKPDEVMRVGGAGHKVVILLQGRADAYVFPTPGTKKWDTCAPEAIVKCLGGNLTDMYGKSLPYWPNSPAHNKEGVLCALRNFDKFTTALQPMWKK
eukprot:CAMPEP_0168545324 /NCGR_PEP_ID=MMETSP0413-20121227/2900_1 /TAXON_ID=136452 /ORGANISM="Filamoeba nolandi, Strain NC-AS-23-1" /LENGTH=301 /DNA_ID=CAMNT_0008575419 /DNA_START=8 /DNA_END=913 /DNA_ORIENTATION=+